MQVSFLDSIITEKGLHDEFFGSIKNIEVEPKTVLLREGETARKLFIIKKGCLRAYFYKDGRDITFQFFLENEAVASMESFFNGTPSQFYIESIEKTDLLVMTKSHLDDLLKKYPDIQKKMSAGIMNRLFYYANHLMSFLKDKPIERYNDLIKRNPQIIQRVPHYYIASYLGITPVSLSRLRNKIDKKKPTKSPQTNSGKNNS